MEKDVGEYSHSTAVLPEEGVEHGGALEQTCWFLCSSYHIDGSFHPNVPIIENDKH